MYEFSVHFYYDEICINKQNIENHNESFSPLNFSYECRICLHLNKNIFVHFECQNWSNATTTQKKIFTASFSLPKEKFSGKEGFKKINMIIPHECTIEMSPMDEDEDNKEDDAVIKNLIKMTDQEEMKKKTKKSEYIQRKTKQLHVNDT